MSVTIITADDLERPAMRELFNEGFSGYLVPMHLDEAAFETHLDDNDIDLSSSPVLVDERPVAFGLVGRRGTEAWIGGMGTVPAARRRGYAQQVLEAAIALARDRGCEAVGLEVIDGNRPALALYEKLGFEVTRDLLVWTRSPPVEHEPGAELDLERARSWIAENRPSAEPWQRSDRIVDKLAQREPGLHAVGLEQGGALVGAAIYALAGDAANVMQVAARDETVAATVLRSAAGSRALRLANVPADEAPSRAMAELGGELVVRQHEMRLGLHG
jgi:ribosomal protein S18 acetylase RimI-like enzyme